MTRKRRPTSKSARPNQVAVSLLGLLLTGAAALWGCGEERGLPQPAPQPRTGTVPGALGDPEQCLDEWPAGLPQVAGAASTRLQVLCRQEYVALYDLAQRVPRVVGEYLRPAEFSGDFERQDNFAPDPDLPEGQGAQLNDFRRSGYDRGHMAPAADFKSSQQAMSESFYLSNMVPQNHDMNAGVWAALESAVRACSQTEGGVYVLTGPVLGAQPRTIGEGVAVPDSLFKVVVSGKDARAFVISNRPQPNDTNFGRYEVTPEMVQELSGVTLFPGGGVTLDRQGRFCRGAFGG